MFDFHRHFTKSPAIENAFYATSSINEWDNLAKFKSLGLLADNLTMDKISFENNLKDKLNSNNKLHIGEIGLDKRYSNFDKQLEFFNSAIKIAYEFDRILTIHIVNANSALIEILEENINKLPKYIIYHGFNKSLELAKQLKKYNVIVSINPKIIKTKLFNNITDLDNLGFLVESDWDQITDQGYNNYFTSFISTLEDKGAIHFKDINNEFRSILENF